MAKYLEAKDKIEEIKLKYSLNAIKDRKKMGIHTVSEHKQLLNRELEIVSGKTMKELLAGSVEDYNKALKELERKSYKLDLMEEGVNYLIYKNQYLKPYLKSDGTVDREKVDKRMKEEIVQNELLVTKRKHKEKKLKKLSGLSNKSLSQSENRSDLLEYFPGIKKIEQIQNSNVIFMEYDYIELDTLQVHLSSSLNYDFMYFEKNDTDEIKNISEIRKVADLYKTLCGKSTMDKIPFVDWFYENNKEFRNYCVPFAMTSIGSQVYINECINKVKDKIIADELKQLCFTTIISTTNPIGPNVVVSSLYSTNIEYDPQKIAIPFCFKDKHVDKIINDGIPVDIYE